MMDHDLKPCLAVDTFRQARTDTSGKTALRPGRGFFFMLRYLQAKKVLTPQGNSIAPKWSAFFHAWLSIPSGKRVLTPQGNSEGGFFHAWLSDTFRQESTDLRENSVAVKWSVLKVSTARREEHSLVIRTVLLSGLVANSKFVRSWPDAKTTAYNNNYNQRE